MKSFLLANRRLIIPTLLFCLLSGCTGSYHGPVSDHFDGKRFYNPGEKDKPQKNLKDLLSRLIEVLQHPWPAQRPTIQYAAKENYTNGIKVNFINHSTILIQSKKVNFLLDPIFSYRASPFPWIGPARHQKPGIELIDLPKIDVVLVSHNHYDHLDEATLKQLNKRFHPLFIVPLGNKKLLSSYEIDNIIELDWWEKKRLPNASIICLPTRHSSQRGLFDKNKTLWGSYAIQVDGKKLYFAGDTGYGNHFKAIRKKWGKADFSFLPIGAYEPRDLLKSDHVNPFESVKSHIDLQSRNSLGIHWGTFHLSTEGLDQPVIDLRKALNQLHVSEKHFFVIHEGVPFYIN